MADEEKVSEQFPELFHYTTVSAFENIYKKKSFWASHYEDMNDRTEFARFRLKVRDFIRPRIREIFYRRIQRDVEIATDVDKHGGIDVVVDKEAERLLDRVHSHTFNKHMYKETFVISFCAHTQPYEAKNGLLSQWRGYGAGGGVAIVFDTSCIEKMMQRDYDVFQLPLMYMIPVIYDDENAIIETKFRDVFECFPKILEICYLEKEQYDEIKLESLFTKMHNHFVLGSTLVKHRAFREENEIRIVVSPRTEDSYSEPDARKQKKEIRYRQIGDRETRYIELFGYMPLPIKRIIVGPSRIQNFNCQRIRGIVNENPCIDVIQSDIPFLG